GAGEHETGLPRIFDVIIVACLAVPRNDFFASVLRHVRPPLCSRLSVLTPFRDRLPPSQRINAQALNSSAIRPHSKVSSTTLHPSPASPGTSHRTPAPCIVKRSPEASPEAVSPPPGGIRRCSAWGRRIRRTS